MIRYPPSSAPVVTAKVCAVQSVPPYPDIWDKHFHLSVNGIEICIGLRIPISNTLTKLLRQQS